MREVNGKRLTGGYIEVKLGLIEKEFTVKLKYLKLIT